MNIFRTLILVLTDLKDFFYFLGFHYLLHICLELRVGELVILLFTSEQLVKIKTTSSSGI